MSSIGHSRPWLRFRKSIAVLAITALGAVGLSAIPASADGPQFARPVADVDAAGWGADPLFQKIDEVTPNDVDSIQADAQGTDAEVTLSSLTDPQTSVGHVVRVRHKTNGTNGTSRLQVQLKESGVVRAEFETVASSDFNTNVYTLSAVEANSITDYASLSIRLVNCCGPNNTPTSWVEFEVPGIEAPPPCDITITGTDTRTTDLVIPEGQKMCFDLGAQLIMDDSSILNYGTVEMRSGKGYIEFRNIDESGFVGGGPLKSDHNGMMMHDPTLACIAGGTEPCAETDPGLWVLEEGVLDVQGSPKTSWTRDPSTAAGWLPGDELRTTPTAPGDFTTFATYTPGDPVPSVSTPFGARTAEVMNLTRDVFIGGQDNTHRAHIFINSMSPQTVKHAEMRFLGPRKLQGSEVKKITGRWALHFHHSHDGSRGSVVEGNVVRDVGGHAIVPHASHGILVKRNVAFTIQEDAYWWDPIAEDPDALSDSIDYIENLGAKITNGDRPDVEAMRFSKATNSLMHGNVMVGVVGGTSSDPAGYAWESWVGWDTRDNVAHNNNVFGIWTYGNPSCADDIHGFDVYNNGQAGVGMDSYDIGLQVHDPISSGSPTGLKLKSVAKFCSTTGLWTTIHNGKFHGMAQAIHVTGHVPDANQPMKLTDCDLHGPVKVRVSETPIGFGPRLGKYDFIYCTADGVRDLAPEDFVVDYMVPASDYRLQQPDGDAWRINADGSATPIAPFYP